MSNRKRTSASTSSARLGYAPAPPGGEIAWTPLESACGCVIDWGWGGPGTEDPLSFILFVTVAIESNCLWHGSETGATFGLPRESTARLQDGPDGQRYIYARRAAASDVGLGQRLTREVRKLAATGAPELIASAPHFARYVRERGEDPAEAIRRQRFIDLILNRGQNDVVAGIDDFESRRQPGESHTDMIARLNTGDDDR